MRGLGVLLHNIKITIDGYTSLGHLTAIEIKSSGARHVVKCANCWTYGCALKSIIANWTFFELKYLETLLITYKTVLKIYIWKLFPIVLFSNYLPVIGMQVAGIGHPLASDPAGHII